jgi:hypothetical protein
MNNHPKCRWVRGVWLLGLMACAGLGCRPGYLKASDLESSGQGPSACAKSCEDIGMRMAALVLVSNSVPGCVCQPVVTTSNAAVTTRSPDVPVTPKIDAPAPAPTEAPATPKVDAPAPASQSLVDAPSDAAAAATTGFIVLAAAAAQHAQQEHLRRAQQQQNY